MGQQLRLAREAYRRRDWVAAARGFDAARGSGEVTADDLFALADAAWWLGDVERSISAGEEAYRRYLHGDRPTMAAMAAMGVAMNLLLRGDASLGSGWMSRASCRNSRLASSLTGARRSGSLSGSRSPQAQFCPPGRPWPG